MFVVELKTTDPHKNLAAEEYFLKQKEGSYFILWRNESSVIVGRNQNTFAEIDIPYAEENNIPVVRRLTGGGAVFHDLGNLNYTFIEENASHKFGDYASFSAPIIEALKSMGIDASLSGRNDICIGDKKISGNAQTMHKGRMLHHGTLLFSSNVATLTNVLKVNPLKIQSKGIKSVKSRVTNISEHIKGDMTIMEFKDLLLKFALKNGGNTLYEITPDDEKEIDRLYVEKYSTKEWNYGFDKDYSFKNEAKFKGGLVTVCFDIKDNKIENPRIFGDFFGVKNIEDFEKKLEGVEYTPDTLKKFLKTQDIQTYFSDISMDELLTIMF